MLDFHALPDPHAEITTGLHVAPRGYSLPRSMRRAIEYIHANLSQDVRLDDIAEAASLSTFHFAREFRKTTGMAPHGYVMRARVGKVKALLVESELSLAAIADEAGFSDQSHMSKVFKRLTGSTPKTFRNDRKLQTANRFFNSLELVRSRVQRLRVGNSVNQT